MSKIININIKINFFKWVMNQSLCYPLLIILGFIAIFGLLSKLYILALLVMILTVIVFILAGTEKNGQNRAGLFTSFISFYLSAKSILKQDLFKDNKAKYKNVIVTSSNAYISSLISVNEDLDLSSFLGSFNNPDTAYTLSTNITNTNQDDVKQYLDDLSTSTCSNYNQLYLDFAFDIQELVSSNELNKVQNNLTLSTDIDRSKDLKIQLKAIENDLKHIQNQNSNSIIKPL